jgi:hypothetical protein
MKFVLNRSRVMASTCGLAVEFVKGEPTHVPPAMYAEVIAAGGVSEEEIDLEPKGADANAEPVDPTVRQADIFKAFETITLRGRREDFTASGAPHAKAMSTILGWTLQNKERDTAWTAFKTKED